MSWTFNPFTGTLDVMRNPAPVPGPHEWTHVQGGVDDIDAALNPLAYPMLAGLAAARPVVGVLGRSYYSTDTLVLERDNGIAWVEVARGEAATRLAQLAERAHGSLTGVGANDHHVRYTDAEAVTAMGVLGDANPLHHDRYTDAGAKIPTLKVTLTNKAGAATVEGYVYRLDPDNNNSFDYASEDEDAQVVVATGVIADNATGAIVIGGYEDVYVDATTAIGDFLYFGSTNGQAKPSKFRNDGCFGIATAARAGAGLVKAYVYTRNQLEKYGTANETSLSGFLPLPFIGTTQVGWTFVAGPGALDSIIDLGAGGAWDDDRIQRISGVVKMPDGRYLIAYSGGDLANWQKGIGLADCPGPPFTSWTKSGNNPIIPVALAGWRSTHVFQPALVLDLENNILHLWYLGTDNAAYNVNVFVGYAFCAANADYMNIANWTNSEAQYQPAAGAVDAIAALRVGNAYLHFIGHSAVKQVYAWRRSLPSGAFTQYATALLSRGAAGQWDDTEVLFPSIFFDSGVYYCIYCGYDGVFVAGSYGVGMATAAGTPFQTFTKLAGNLLGQIIPVQVGKYNAFLNLQASLMRLNRTYYLFSVGRPAAVGANDRVGLWKMEL